uniref:F-box domain-containing protein n=1 Tax=Acrobeloides nanus TaxID=290746 RepID=A0A914CFC3_9BILA
MFIPSEVLWDVFVQLSRDEVEKCQLVSLPWNSVINYHAKEIPLRKFYRLLFNGVNWRLDPAKLEAPTSSTREWKNFGKFAENEEEFDQRAKSLKFCIFEEVNIAMNNDALNAMKGLADKSGERIKTMLLRTKQPFYLYRRVFEDYVLADELAVNFELKEMVSLFRNPRLLEIPNPPYKIRFECHGFPGTESIDAFLRFFERGETLGANRYTWYFGKLTEKGFRRILESFLHVPDPKRMLRNIKFDFLFSDFDKLSRIALADQARDLLSRHVTSYTTDIEGEDLSQTTTYEVRRKDGWMLKIIFLTSWKNHLNAPISAEFVVEKFD